MTLFLFKAILITFKYSCNIIKSSKLIEKENELFLSKLFCNRLCNLILFKSTNVLFILLELLFWTIFGPRKLFPIKFISYV
jgi:hypothetical protein